MKANRRKFLGILASALAWFLVPAPAQEGEERKRGGRNKREGGDYVLPSELAAFAFCHSCSAVSPTAQ